MMQRLSMTFDCYICLIKPLNFCSDTIQTESIQLLPDSIHLFHISYFAQSLIFYYLQLQSALTRLMYDSFIIMIFWFCIFCKLGY